MRNVRVESDGDHSPAQAWLLAGWLASRLGWAQPGERVSVRAAGGSAEAVLRSVSLELVAGSEQRRVSVESTSGVLCVTSDLGGTPVTRAVAHQEPDLLSLMSRLLDESREDLLYPPAVAQAAALLG